MGIKKSCKGCKCLEDYGCQLGYLIRKEYKHELKIFIPLENCPKPRTGNAWIKARDAQPVQPGKGDKMKGKLRRNLKNCPIRFTETFSEGINPMQKVVTRKIRRSKYTCLTGCPYPSGKEKCL